MKGVLSEERGSRAWEDRQTARKRWGSGELHILSRLKDALHTIRVTTGWAYLWH
jgi:hypothetical protein